MSALGWFGKILVGGCLFSSLLGAIKTNGDGEPDSQVKHQNLYTPGTLIHNIVNQLDYIAPGMTFYFIHAEEKRAAFPKDLIPEMRASLAPGIEEKGHSFSFKVMGYMSMKDSSETNTCSIYLMPSAIAEFSERREIGLTKAYLGIIAHESIHCGHSKYSRTKQSWRKYYRLAKEYANTYESGEKTTSEITSVIEFVHAESFVGAYFLTQMQASEKSVLMEALAQFGWEKEYELSQNRGYRNSFNAIAALCAKAGDCPPEIPELHAKLLNDATYQRALLADAKRHLERVDRPNE